MSVPLVMGATLQAATPEMLFPSNVPVECVRTSMRLAPTARSFSWSKANRPWILWRPGSAPCRDQLQQRCGAEAFAARRSVPVPGEFQIRPHSLRLRFLLQCRDAPSLHALRSWPRHNCPALWPGGIRSVVAESVLLKHQLLILNRSHQQAPNLRASDRSSQESAPCSCGLPADPFCNCAETVDLAEPPSGPKEPKVPHTVFIETQE